MEVLSFDIEGKFAHFRKFHGNNTAMSYSIPPRTTIIGILAAIVGEEKNSYYQEYQDRNLKIGIRVLERLKKSFHRVNFLKITSPGDFGGKNGRIQTPFEVVTSENLTTGSVKYRFYLCQGEDTEIYTRIKDKLINLNRHFNVSLGIAGFAAFISNVKIWNASEEEASNKWLYMHSACNSESVSEIDFPDDKEFKFNHIEEELLPADFIGGEKGREVYRMNRVLFATCNFPIRVKLSGTYYTLPGNEKGEPENIQFLKYAGIFSQQES